MFLHLLSPDQRDLFFRAATALAHVDGLDLREAALLEQAQLEWGLSLDSGGGNIEIEAAAGQLAELASQAPGHVISVLLVELAGIAVADESHTSEELDLYNRFGRALSADPNRLQGALDLASRWRELAADSESFLAGG